MKKLIAAAALAATALTMSSPAAAQGGSRSQRALQRGTAAIPHCARPLGSLAVVEPDNNWWSGLGLSSPEAIIKVFVSQSGCFTLVDRNRGLQSRNIERALADNGELQRGSNIGRGQVRAADYFMVPDIVTQNANASGTNLGGLVGGVGRIFGGHTGRGIAAVAGGLSSNSSEANVTLALVNARTTEQERVTQGFGRRRDVSFGLGAGGVLGQQFGAVGGGSYQNTQIGQVIVLAYLDAYTQMVQQLGGLPDNAAAAAPRATR